MLKSNNRLTKVRDFNLVMKYGRWVSGRFLRIKWLKLAEIEDYFPKKEDVNKFKKQLRLAIVVGVKVGKSAVKRNRLKRQMREVARLLIKSNRLPDGHYLMLVAQKEMLDKNYAEISEEIKLLFEKILKKY
jgi:ribonuclease P protein component